MEEKRDTARREKERENRLRREVRPRQANPPKYNLRLRYCGPLNHESQDSYRHSPNSLALSTMKCGLQRWISTHQLPKDAELSLDAAWLKSIISRTLPESKIHVRNNEEMCDNSCSLFGQPGNRRSSIWSLSSDGKS